MSTTILRRPEVAARLGIATNTTYDFIARGILMKPIAVGLRARGWQASEVEALVKARCAEKSEDEIKALVVKLTAARKLSA